MEYMIVAALTFIFCATLFLVIVALGFSLRVARVLMTLHGEEGITPENTFGRFGLFYTKVMK